VITAGARSARGLGVVAGEERALGRHPVALRSVEAADLVDGGDAGVAEGHVVQHDVHDVRLRPEPLFQLRQPGIEFGVLDCPGVAVLVEEEVVLGIVYHRTGGRVGRGDSCTSGAGDTGVGGAWRTRYPIWDPRSRSPEVDV
jgi:hypothetical protein